MTAGFLWLFSRGLEPADLGRVFARLSVPAVAVALVFLVAGWGVRILRWWHMLRVLDPGLPFVACVRPFLAGMALNNLLPLRAGDAFRVVGCRRWLQAPAARVAGTVVIERILDVVALLAIFFFCLAGLPAGVFPRGFVQAAIWGAGGVLVAMLCLLLLASWLQRSAARLAGHRWSNAAAMRHIGDLAGTLALVRSLPRMLALFGLSAVAWACEGAVFAAVALALGIDAELFGPWLSLAAGTLATALPSAPGYIGTFHYFAAQGIAAYGVSAETAAAFALTVHAVLWLPSTAAGLLCLMPDRGGSRGAG